MDAFFIRIFMDAVGRLKKLYTKNHPKIDFTGVEIAWVEIVWVELKSNKPVEFMK